MPIAQALLSAGAAVDPRMSRRKLTKIRSLIAKTPTAAALIKAARHGDVDRVETLLAQGAPVNQAVDNETALRVAARKGHVEVVRRLLAAGADVNATRATGALLWWTNTSALGYAAMKGHVDVVRALLAGGAAIGTTTAMIGPGSTPLSYAAGAGSDEVVDVLIAAGAPIDPDALAVALEKPGLGHVPSTIRQTLYRYIEEVRRKEGKPGPSPAIAPCPCQSFGGNPDEHRGEGLRVTQTDHHQGWSEIYCECKKCHRRWKVESDSGYHYTLYHWSNITGGS